MPTVMQWVAHLLAKIDAQARYADPFERRYSNKHVLPFLQKEYAEVYPGLIVASADGRTVNTVVGDSMPWISTMEPPRSGTAGIVVDALTERLVLDGLGTPDDSEADRLLAKAWEDSDLDVMHQLGHQESLIGARSFVSIARERDGNRAVAAIESATQAAVHRRQAPPYDVDACLKVWTDEWTGKRVGLLRLPGTDYDLREDEAPQRDPEGSGVFSRWAVDGEPRATRLAGVPAVELAPRARLLKDPVSEIEPIATLIDVVDLVEGLLVFAGHFGAVPIRWATGLDVARDPKDPTKPLLGPDGKPIIGFNPRADHLFVNSSKDGRFGQLEPAGLASFVVWAEHASAKVRAKTAIASTYFSLDLKSHMSAELLKTDEAPMVRRVGRMGGASLNQAWRRVGRWILAIEAPGSRARVRPRWVSPETRIDAQLVDQFTKLTASGLGVSTVGKKLLGWAPEDVDKAVNEAEEMRQRLRAERQEDDMDPVDRLSRELFPDGDPALLG